MVATSRRPETDSTKNDVLFSLSILWPIFLHSFLFEHKRKVCR
jgi:hypothetical protein